MPEGPPPHRRSLEQRLRNISRDEVEFLDKRRQLANTAVLKALAVRRDQRGAPLFVVKGGVSLELEFGNDARPTTDLDVSYLAERQLLDDLLRDALAAGWEEFEFRLASDLEPIAATGSWRCDVKVSYLGDPLQTIRLEVGMAEGAAGRETREIRIQTINPREIGLADVQELPAVTPQYSIAQKLHACTDHSHPNRPNDRSRDLIDIIQLWRSLDSDARAAVRAACAEVFAARDRHPWPPVVEIVENWRTEFPQRAKQLGFEPGDVDAAAAEVIAIIKEIDVS